MSVISVTVRGSDKGKLIPVADIKDIDEDSEGSAVINYKDGRDRLPVSNTYDALQTAIQAALNPLNVTSYLQITDGIAAPGAGGGVARIYVDTSDGDLKVVFADGTVKVISADT